MTFDGFFLPCRPAEFACSVCLLSLPHDLQAVECHFRAISPPPPSIRTPSLNMAKVYRPVFYQQMAPADSQCDITQDDIIDDITDDITQDDVISQSTSPADGTAPCNCNGKQIDLDTKGDIR